MLEEMRISGLGVIDDAVLELAPGLTVVTGETGAGKTMVVTGLGLLFGGRADPGAVRPGVAQAVVEGRIRVDANGVVAARALDAGAGLDDDGVLVVVRTVSSGGRSRAHLGGRGVPASVLTELAESCVAVHGQSDQSRLLMPARQRKSLDQFAGTAVEAPLEVYRRAYDDLRSVVDELVELTRLAQSRAQESDLLRFGLEEIERADPLPGEAEALLVEEERLGNADSLRAALEEARSALLGDDTGSAASGSVDGAVALVGSSRAALEQVGVSDPVLAEIVGRLRESGYLLADVGADLAAYGESVEADPARLEVVAARRAELARLAKKYVGEASGAAGASAIAVAAVPDTAASVLEWGRRASARVTELEGDDDRIETLTSRRSVLVAGLERAAGSVSRARSLAAARFGAAVSVELSALAMGGAEVTLAVLQREVDASGSARAEAWPASLIVDGRSLAFDPYGVDEVALLLKPHAGAVARPLQKGASGGELSRVMLAVEVVLVGTDPVPTLVFDEVDSGVGGKAAVEVGRRLAALSRSAQVLVVTHLPQVAAFADQHLVVRKSQAGAVTRSGVVALDEAGRVRELSRMLAGQEESATAEAHARELLTNARLERVTELG